MGVSVADLLSEHGSPLWLANLDVVRDRWRSFTAAWDNVWPEVEVAYCYQANRLPAILRTLAAAGAGHQVACEAEYVLARTVARAPGKRIVVQGPYKSVDLLESAARDGALVVADSEDDLRRATAAGVRRLGLRVETAAVGHGPSQYGVPDAKVTAVHRDAAARGLRLEALAVNLPITGFQRPLSQVRQFIEDVVTRWPQPPERYAAATRLVASLAVRLGVPVVDVGGGLPPAPDEQVYARTIAGALGAVGFEGRVLAEPGRAIVGEAVELACTVRAVKRLSDGTRCVVVDAGTDLLPGARWRWPHVDAPYATGPPAGPALIAGALCSHLEILHPRVKLPAVAEGEVLLIRRVGAYNQSQSTQSGDLHPAVIARDRGEWRPCERRETIDDLIATDLGERPAPSITAPTA
jgi:diaminopimelate decarboxylase